MIRAITKLVKTGAAIACAATVSNCIALGDYDPLSVEIRSEMIIASGVIDGTTPTILGDAIQQNPNAKTLILLNVPGSVDDISNLKIAREVRAAGLKTVVPADGMVASGGTDLFLAGVQRTIESGACIGVHSWAGGTIFNIRQGRDYPKDAPEHEKYLNYYDQMGIPSEFYWYTLDVADAESIHWMRDSEIKRYAVGEIVPAKSPDATAQQCDER